MKRPFSIGNRLLLSSLLILIIFLGLTGLALNAAHHHELKTGLRDQLRNHVYTLLAAASEDERGRLTLPENIAAPRFNQPDSGLYARIDSEQAHYHWRSASLLGRDHQFQQVESPGQQHFSYQQNQLIIHFGIAWEDLDGNNIEYSLSIAQDLSAHRQQLAHFNSSLWKWLGGSGLVLLLSQLILLRWGLSPLRQLTHAIGRIESGEAEQLSGTYPTELQPLSNSLNSLIQQNQQRQKRLRNGLADLAHSLKTPLAVLRGAAESAQPQDLPEYIHEQVQRIDQIVHYQHQRAAIAGSNPLAKALPLLPIVQRICNSLDKVYRDKNVMLKLDINDDIQLRADAADLFELFGNLLDNAYKHARSQIIIAAKHRSQILTIFISDDGPGIAEEDVERVLQRGERADQRNSGQGIGLAVADEIIHHYNGILKLSKARIGGVEVKIEFPNTLMPFV